MTKHSVISARVDADTMALVDNIAAAQGRSRAWLVAQAVREYAEREAEMLAFIEEGERSAREEPLISADEMLDWIAAKREEIRAKRNKDAA
ncbi:putative transcriptional regulator [Sphingopyxis panaciterrae]|uniref:CopG family ribbon-helix-helix protein n=1 Tax=Sphingopyxis panaciterrae TaxID=363841 RepID=UPI00142402CB|nr:ribbon-helix-helix domain-containing protein [Sphingopyxis panaciterrae]NIJ38113.1 putative transcriptional regulator [Sphingopyxis panaciterrae]